jgi:subtilisin family serine protease
VTRHAHWRGVIGLVVLLALAAVALLAPAAGAAPVKTLPGLGSWDMDMIDASAAGTTGAGVYVAVLDTGLSPNWKDYLPAGRVATQLGKGFVEDIKWDSAARAFVESGKVRETGFIGDTGSTHGTHVTSTILGFNYQAPADAAAGFPLPPVFVQGVAPAATIIPVKVLADYTIGKSQLTADYPDQKFVMGTDRAVAAGIRYATDLKIKGYSPMVVTMSLGGDAPSPVMEDAVDYAVSHGVIVVAAAGNEGALGMGWPGAYPQVISVGACGWKYEWYWPGYVSPAQDGRYRLWWLQDSTYGNNDVAEGTALAGDVYITDFSSRELPGQQLDVVAPGSWVRGPYPGGPGYAHLPWWSEGMGWLKGHNPGNFYYLGGTSMATPHVTGVAAQMLQKDPGLDQAQVEEILKGTALAIPAPSSMTIWDYSAEAQISWGADATGAGLVQAGAAVAATP